MRLTSMTRRTTSTGVSARSPRCSVAPALLTTPVSCPSVGGGVEERVHLVGVGDVGPHDLARGRRARGPAVAVASAASWSPRRTAPGRGRRGRGVGGGRPIPRPPPVTTVSIRYPGSAGRGRFAGGVRGWTA